MNLYDLTGSGISCLDMPRPEQYDDAEDFEAAWLEWADEYPEAAKKAVAVRMEY